MELIKLNSVKDFNCIQKFFNDCTPYSDFSPISLVSWSHGDDIFYNISENGLVLKMPRYLEEGYMFLLFITKFSSTFVEELTEVSKEYQIVPEECLKHLPDSCISTSDRDSFDYVYDVNVLGNLDSFDSTLGKKVRKFEHIYDQINVKVLDLTVSSITTSLVKLCSDWCDAKGFSVEAKSSEITAIETYIQYASYIMDYSIGVYQREQLIAFTLNELHSKQWCLGHFGKSDYSYKGLSLISEYYTSKLLLKKGIKFLNHQQDTGINSLRTFKESLGPIKFLKKYKVKFI